MLKRIVKSSFAGRIASLLIGAYIRLVSSTSRWTYVNVDRFHEAANEGHGVILAFWHGRMLMLPKVRSLTDRRAHMLISSHRDGEIIANGVKSFGIEFIRGSAANPKKPQKDKSGAPAITQMLAALGNGDVVGLTPDGPRGPGRRSKIGVIRLAKMSGAPIVPGAFSVSRGKELKTWDNFLVAAPFSRGYYVAGDPIYVPPDADVEGQGSARKALEDALDDVTRKADALANRNDAVGDEG